MTISKPFIRRDWLPLGLFGFAVALHLVRLLIGPPGISGDSARLAIHALDSYIPWITIFYEYGSSGFTTEFMTGVNLPAMYWALRKSADGSPDPKTGENTTISSAYRVAAVPAFLVTKDQNEARR